MSDEILDLASEAIASAEALVIGAGAGMGDDSGLPTFRGAEGFWNAYPPYRALGLSFVEMANPRHFAADPGLGWGFYGHRRNLYRRTPPHRGFDLLRGWMERAPLGGFVFTSNVDGHFSKAGFDSSRIVEVHGAIDFLQCLDDCGAGIVPAGEEAVIVDESTMRAGEPLPRCPACGSLARPNILMFGDFGWDASRTQQQEARFRRWLRSIGSARLVIVEIGAGSAIPTVRRTCEALGELPGATLIRINPGEPEVPSGHLGLLLGALAALEAVSARMV